MTTARLEAEKICYKVDMQNKCRCAGGELNSLNKIYFFGFISVTIR